MFSLQPHCRRYVMVLFKIVFLRYVFPEWQYGMIRIDGKDRASISCLLSAIKRLIFVPPFQNIPWNEKMKLMKSWRLWPKLTSIKLITFAIDLSLYQNLLIYSSNNTK